MNLLPAGVYIIPRPHIHTVNVTRTYLWRKQVRSPSEGLLEDLEDEVEVADVLLLIAHQLSQQLVIAACLYTLHTCLMEVYTHIHSHVHVLTYIVYYIHSVYAYTHVQNVHVYACIIFTCTCISEKHTVIAPVQLSQTIIICRLVPQLEVGVPPLQAAECSVSQTESAVPASQAIGSTHTKKYFISDQQE